jgi:hypothetical protein
MRRLTLPAAFLMVFALAACGGGEGDAPAGQSTLSTVADIPQPTPQPTPDPVQVNSTSPPVVVFMGDSITYGWTLPAGIYNEGVNGQVSSEMLARFQTDVLSHDPTVVAILAGTNDLLKIEYPNTDSIAAMAAAAQAGGACVILGTVPPDTSWVADGYTQAAGDRRVAEFNSALLILAHSYGYLVADYHAALINADGTQNPALFLPDGIHPTTDGHAAMWNVVHPLLDRCEGS